MAKLANFEGLDFDKLSLLSLRVILQKRFHNTKFQNLFGLV